MMLNKQNCTYDTERRGEPWNKCEVPINAIHVQCAHVFNLCGLFPVHKIAYLYVHVHVHVSVKYVPRFGKTLCMGYFL